MEGVSTSVSDRQKRPGKRGFSRPPRRNTEPGVNVFRPDRPGIRKVLGDLETEIMEFVWRCPPGRGATVRDVLEALSQRRHIAYTTVMTTMVRLARKNLLRVKKQDAAYIYSPILTQDEFVSRVAGRILEDLLVGFTGETIAKLRSLADPRVAARARQLLDEIARRRRVEEDE